MRFSALFLGIVLWASSVEAGEKFRFRILTFWRGNITIVAPNNAQTQRKLQQGNPYAGAINTDGIEHFQRVQITPDGRVFLK